MDMIVSSYKSLIDFLKENASIVNVGKEKWYYCPFWFKEEGEKLVMINLNNLPNEVFEHTEQNSKCEPDGNG